MTIKIGLKIKNIKKSFNFSESEKSKDKSFTNFLSVEIASVDKSFQFRKRNLDHFKEMLKGKDLSLHSQTKRIFTEENQTIEKMKLQTLKSEIYAAKYLDCNEIIVHLKNGKLNKKEIKEFLKIKKIAEENNLEILYEPNTKFSAKDFLYNVKKLRTNINLDLCHLAVSYNEGILGMPLNKFLNKIKEKTVYIHASNYKDGEEHVGLSKGTLDWKSTLNKLEVNSSESLIKKIIIEVHNPEEIPETKRDLEDFINEN